jgi:TRAP-type transport system small permease protein
MPEPVRLTRVASRSEEGITSASKIMVYVSAVALFGMMMVTVADVVGRYVFSKPIKGAFELVGFLMVFAGTWGIAYCQIKKGHIRVDFILQRFSKRVQAILTSVAYFMGLIIFSVLAWRLALLAKYYLDLERGNSTDTLGIPLFPFVVTTVIGMGMMALVLLFDFVHSLTEVKGK